MNLTRHIEKSLDKSLDLYANADPFPHIVIDDFLPPAVIDSIIEVFPKPSDEFWRQRIADVYQHKLASNKVDEAPEAIRDVMYQLNSATTLKALERLTGEGPLIADPFFEGGGLHQIERGGFLSVHADFNKPRHLPIYRRLNLIVYLNKDWEPSFGGELELWDRESKNKVKGVSPIANRAVIFTTDTTSFHGHPVPLSCPPDRSRRSLALYYYSVTPAERDHTGTTTRWRLASGSAPPSLRQNTATFLWKAAGKLQNIASRIESQKEKEHAKAD